MKPQVDLLQSPAKEDHDSPWVKLNHNVCKMQVNFKDECIFIATSSSTSITNGLPKKQSFPDFLAGFYGLCMTRQPSASLPLAGHQASHLSGRCGQ